MKIVDFTHLIEPEMPVYPGTEPPRLSPANSYEKDGFRETRLEMFSHTGTHMDAPAHIFPTHPCLDEMPADQFSGTALVVDCRDAQAGEILGMNRLTELRALADQADFLLFQTGWDRYWGREEYFGEYPVIGEDVAEYLIASGKKGVGVDAIGVDPVRDTGLYIHHWLLRTGRIVIIENLTGLDAAGRGLFTFCALPLKFQKADGAPVRAVGIL